MKLNKIIASAITVGLLSTGAFAADTSNYVGVKYASLSSDSKVYGNDSGELTGPFTEYENMNLVGVEWQLLSNLESSPLMWGLGADIMFNDGSFLDGGMADVDFKLGSYYRDANFYALVGVGLQSFSSYTVAAGLCYGVGANYNIFEHMAAKVEYRVYDMETGTSDEATANQTYELSGLYLGLSYKF